MTDRQTDKYIGIDYGMGTSNVDKTNGIRYGVISMNSINLDCTESFEYDYGTPHCPHCGNDAVTIPTHTEQSNPPGQWVSVIVDTPEAYEEYEGSGDYACENCERLLDSSEVFADEPIGWSYDADGYELTGCLDNDIFVLTSPYYTFRAILFTLRSWRRESGQSDVGRRQDVLLRRGLVRK